MEGKIGLRETIAALRQELAESMRDGQGEDLRFRLESIDLELQIVAASENEGGLGAKFWVLNASAKEKFTEQAVQTIKLRLTPRSDPSGADPEGDDVWIRRQQLRRD